MFSKLKHCSSQKSIVFRLAFIVVLLSMLGTFTMLQSKIAYASGGCTVVWTGSISSPDAGRSETIQVRNSPMIYTIYSWSGGYNPPEVGAAFNACTRTVTLYWKNNNVDFHQIRWWRPGLTSEQQYSISQWSYDGTFDSTTFGPVHLNTSYTIKIQACNSTWYGSDCTDWSPTLKITTSITPFCSSAGSHYYKIVSYSSGKVLEVSGYSTANGGRVDQWGDVNQANEAWKFTLVGGGYYKIVSCSSGKVLEVSGYSTANGGRVDQWDDVNQTNEAWRFIAAGRGYYKIVSRSSGKILEVNGYSTANGGRVDQWDDVNQTNEVWALVAA